jgi:hypothetical protein
MTAVAAFVAVLAGTDMRGPAIVVWQDRLPFWGRVWFSLTPSRYDERNNRWLLYIEFGWISSIN